MNGSDFLTLAVQLAASSEEANLRSAVSRAYYGVFHLGRALLEELGVRLPATEKEHVKIPHCLLNSGCPTAEAAGRLMEDLRRERNLADYDLRQLDYRSPRHVLQRIASAQRCDELIRRCQSTPDRDTTREGVRRYATDVLRLPIIE